MIVLEGQDNGDLEMIDVLIGCMMLHREWIVIEIQWTAK